MIYLILLKHLNEETSINNKNAESVISKKQRFQA